jgi:hypothetical protein
MLNVDLPMPETVSEMIVDQSAGLHEGIANGRAGEI